MEGNMVVYMLLLRNNKGKEEIYTGQTNNFERRLNEHRTKCGGKYTKGREFVRVLRTFGVSCRSEALLLEAWLKKPEHKRLRYMLAGMIPWTPKMKQRWDDLKEVMSIVEHRN